MSDDAPLPAGMVLQAVVLRIYPTKAQAAQMERIFGARRKVWNELLDLQNRRTDRGEKLLGQVALDQEITKLKARPDLHWLNEAPSDALQRVSKNLCAAFKRYFDVRAKIKAGQLPRPKPKKPRKDGRPDFWPTFKPRRADGGYYVSNTRFDVFDSRSRPEPPPADGRPRWVDLTKIGKMPFRSGRAAPMGEQKKGEDGKFHGSFFLPHGGTVRNGTVRLRGGKWYFVMQFTGPPPRRLGQPSVDVIGLDVGTGEDTFVVRSDTRDGETATIRHKARKPFKNAERRLARLQRKHRKRSVRERAEREAAGPDAPKPRRSNRGRHLDRQIARLHARIANVRRDCQHVASARVIAKAEQPAYQDMSVKAMMRSRRRGKAKSTADAGMGELHRQVEYKAEWYRGVEPHKVDRWHRTSGVCPSSGWVTPVKLDEKIRRWFCEPCGVWHDRDEAAAKVIAKAAASSREVGPVRSDPTKRVEILNRGLGDQERGGVGEARSPRAVPEGIGGEPPHPFVPVGARRRRRRGGPAAQPEADLASGLSPPPGPGLP